MADAPFILLPGTVRAKLDQTDHEIQGMWTAAWSWSTKQYELSVEGQTVVEAIGALKQEWDGFYEAGEGASSLWGANFDAAESFRQRAAELWDRASVVGITGLALRPIPDSRPSVLPALGLSIGLVAAVIGLVVVLKWKT